MRTPIPGRVCCLLLLAACGYEGEIDDPGELGDSMIDAVPDDEIASTEQAVTCPPRMTRNPVGAAHNIGYDSASCGSGTCRISCPDQNANSDYGGSHHGIDVFAFHRAPLVAAANGTVVAVGTPSSTSGLRVRIRDACGWEYYYGHMDQAVVSVGQGVSAGQLIGYMGRTGAASTHLHFNISPNGNYSNDINPFNLLNSTSGTSCAAPAPPPPPPPPPSGCGVLGSGQSLVANQAVGSCDGRFTFIMQGDGNLVLYQAGRGAIWSTGTHGSGANIAIMQGDGNLVLYRPGGVPVWHTHTNGRTNAWLTVQGDGNTVIYQGSTPIWSTGTCCR